MKNQRMKTEARSFRFPALALIVLMVATLICSFTVLASAEAVALEIDPADLVLSADGNVKLDSKENYYKVYDGNTTVTGITVNKAAIGIAEGDKVEVTVNAVFNNENVDGAKYITVSVTLSGDDAAKYTAPEPFTVGAYIKPQELKWSGNGTASFVYELGKSSYENVKVTLPEFTTLDGAKVEGVTASLATVAVNGISKAGTYANAAKATVGLSSTNYTIGLLPVDVEVKPIEIIGIEWSTTKREFVWGNTEADVIKALGLVDSDGDGKGDTSYELAVTYYAEDGSAVQYDGSVGKYKLVATSPDADNIVFAKTADESAETSIMIEIGQLIYVVSMPDVSYLGNYGVQANPTVFVPVINGEIPADVRAQITFTVGGNAFTGASEYGIYDVTASLPANKNYKFQNAAGEDVTTLNAKMYVNRQYIAVGTTDAPYQIILIGENGFSDDITATVTIPEKLARKAIQGYRYHKEYTLTVSGAEGQSFTALITIEDELYSSRCEALTAADVYIYDQATGEKYLATEKGYTVTVEDGRVRVEGISGSGSTTILLAPVYNMPFWLTAPGIALLILLICLLLVLLFLIGMYLRRIRNTKENEEMVIDTEGDVPEVVPAEVEDKVDEEQFLEDKADEIADGLDGETDAEEATDEDVAEAVAEAMNEVIEEASAMEAEETQETEESVTEDEDVVGALVDEKAEELQETVEPEAEEAEADEDALRDAVAAAMAENFNESADSSDALLIVAGAEEEEEDGISPEDFKAVVDAIVSDAMCSTMEIPEETSTEEESAEAAEAPAAEETAEVEEATEESVVVEEMSGEDICAVVADSVAEAFELVTVDGVAPKAVEGTTVETITEAVGRAGEEHIPENWTDELADAVKAAVVDELAARLLVEEEEPAAEEAVEAFVAVADESNESDEDDDDDGDDNDDNDDAEEEDSFGDYDGSEPLVFIDVMEEPEKYQEMLEQEARGEIRIVTRYRRSFQSRLIQSQGNVQDYYSILKNELLAHKGVKNRISWNYEAFNRGRVHVAKMNAKTKTLYLYLALDPEELKDTKYGIVDVSSKKKYASVPVLMKIKGDRKFKYALELIDKLCQEKLELPKMEIEEVDYRVPYQTTEELVQSRVVKKLVASIPVADYEPAEAAEDATAENTVSAATEAQEVSFVAPSDAPAVEAAAEEVAAEEAVTEAPAEDVAADAAASDDEPKQV